MSAMEAVNIVMRLFKAMDDDEKKEVVLQIGTDIADTGLTHKWGETKTSAPPKKKRRGSYRPYWMKRVDSADKSKRGMDQLAGGWVSEKELPDLKNGQVVLLGIKGGDYCVCTVGRGYFEFEDARGDKHIVHWIECQDRFGQFKDAVNACEELMGI